MAMTPRERFISALERKPLKGLVPHFELVFFLTMEAFGKIYPSHTDGNIMPIVDQLVQANPYALHSLDPHWS